MDRELSGRRADEPVGLTRGLPVARLGLVPVERFRIGEEQLCATRDCLNLPKINKFCRRCWSVEYQKRWKRKLRKQRKAGETEECRQR